MVPKRRRTRHSNAQLIVGAGYLDDEKYNEAAKWIQKAAENGDAEAQNTLAGLYSNGQGVQQSEAQALEWAKKSADQGNVKGLHDVGFFLCCKMPSTIQYDEATAYMWFLVAYQAGDEKAPTFLASLRADLKKEQISDSRVRANEWLSAHGRPTLTEDPVEKLFAKSQNTTKESHGKNGQTSEPGSEGLSEALAKAWTAADSTPGAQLAFKEVGRGKLGQNYGDAEGKTGVTYNLIASGFSKGPVYTLWLWTLGTEPRPAVTGFLVDDSGNVDCSASSNSHKDKGVPDWCDKPLDMSNLTMTGARGEPKRAALVSADMQVRGFAKTIPFPIEAKDGPCLLTVEMVEPPGNSFEIRGVGFQPNEEVDVVDQSEDEVMRDTRKASARGEVGGLELPAMAGKNSGSASWAVQGKTCRMKVQNNWGKAAFEWQ